MDEVVTGHSETEVKDKNVRIGSTQIHFRIIQEYTSFTLMDLMMIVVTATDQFLFPSRKKELPSGMGTIFSLGGEKSGLSGTTPETGSRPRGSERVPHADDHNKRCDVTRTFQPLDGSQLLVLLPVIHLILQPHSRQG